MNTNKIKKKNTEANAAAFKHMAPNTKTILKHRKEELDGQGCSNYFTPAHLQGIAGHQFLLFYQRKKPSQCLHSYLLYDYY